MEQKVKVTMRPYLGCAWISFLNKCKQTEDHSDGTKGQGHNEAILGLCLKKKYLNFKNNLIILI